MKIWVNGLQRTGTNYIVSILKDNTNEKIIDYDESGHWKHDIQGKPHDITPNTNIDSDIILTVLKNPYTWVESVCFRNQVDIVEWFPQYNLRGNNNDLGPFNINLERLITLYKDWYKSWYEVEGIKVQYEKLLEKRYIKKFLIEELGIETKGIKIRDQVPYSNKIDKNRIEEYKQFKLKYLNQDHINIINGVLGREFIHKLGYKIK